MTIVLSDRNRHYMLIVPSNWTISKGVHAVDPLRVSTYGGGESLHEKLLELMEGAQKRIWIKVPWWDASPPARLLANAAISAKQRGVDVVLLCRPEASNDAILRDLRRAGVSITGIRYIHEKELIADDVAVSHSMNFTQLEIERNQNSGFVLQEHDVVEAVEAGFLKLLENQAAANVGDEKWTPSTVLIPSDLQKFLTRYDRLNPLQSKAVPAVLSTSGHVMVVAPTSSGKTLIGEVAALRSIVTEGKPAVWLLPARALAAEIGDTAKRWNEYGIRTVELTGETSMSSDAVRNAQLWVATTEKFEALYRRSSLRDFIAKVGCLIIDEVHLVGDPERGATLESLIARLRAAEERTRIVALSATVSNADQLAEWFNAQLISSAWRPTKLMTQLIPYKAPRPGAKREEHEAAKDRALRPLLQDLLAPAPPGSEVIDARAVSDGGGVLVFCGSKNGVRRTAALAADVPFRNIEDSKLVEDAFHAGVGLHFRDAPRANRALNAFKDRSIRTLVATSGLSTGVNTPARAVVIRDLELGMSALEVSQAQQMFGRAGRAGQELEGFGFMLVPHDQEALWRRKLDAGYTAHSRISDRLGDVLLAEILLGSITDRVGASSWFEETFAYAQTGEPQDVDDALDHLVRRGFVTESEARLTVTEIGALTSRLMIDVESAGELLTALAESPLPTHASEAEEFVLQIIATHVGSLREWPVNQKVYDAIVQHILVTWTPRVTARVGKNFGSRFCMAAAHLALRDRQKLNAKPPQGILLADFRRAIEDMPRYLAWIAALGYIGTGTWASAVAGDLARRLSWWNLSPHPERGSGRLLWMLERMLAAENRKLQMQGLWSRASGAGFSSPDRLNAKPRDVDVSAEGFTDLLHGRADLKLESLVGLSLLVKTAAKSSRLTALSNTGVRRAVATVQPVPGQIELTVPASRDSGQIAVDAFLYTREGDFAYQNLIADLPPDLESLALDPRVEASRLVDQLDDQTVVEPRLAGLRRLLMSDRKKRYRSALPFLSPDPQLRHIALALAEHEVEPELVIVNLRTNLRSFLARTNTASPRLASTVLRSGRASEQEVELTLLALAGSLQIETGVATAAEKLVALVRIDDEWKLAMSSTSNFVRVEPLIPDSLPQVLSSVQPRRAAPEVAATPRCGWMRDFAPPQ
ncbi:DEAD/DEAH box helicase [Rhodococcus sp. ACPA4]|uniref:DEAD/DEAH box helicase n=1 Tax=Rhodococcus sp. ACPA4 TaxID=2028571 RepID=UPI00117A705E|nr:DEAD/DEAH box helicase [Rhodococcus sp. ACPA4]